MHCSNSEETVFLFESVLKKKEYKCEVFVLEVGSFLGESANDERMEWI